MAWWAATMVCHAAGWVLALAMCRRVGAHVWPWLAVAAVESLQIAGGVTAVTRGVGPGYGPGGLALAAVAPLLLAWILFTGHGHDGRGGQGDE